MKSNLVSKSQTAEILNEISCAWGVELPKIRNLRIHQIPDGGQIISGQGMRVLKAGDEYVPFLADVGLLEKFPCVTVDMGAVRFMCNGANLMRPGITSFGDFEIGSMVCIAEESQHKFLAVGKAVVPSSELDSMEKGMVVESLHHISDKFWEAGKVLRD